MEMVVDIARGSRPFIFTYNFKTENAFGYEQVRQKLEEIKGLTHCFNNKNTSQVYFWDDLNGSFEAVVSIYPLPNIGYTARVEVRPVAELAVREELNLSLLERGLELGEVIMSLVPKKRVREDKFISQGRK